MCDHKWICVEQGPDRLNLITFRLFVISKAYPHTWKSINMKLTYKVRSTNYKFESILHWSDADFNLETLAHAAGQIPFNALKHHT